MPLSSITEKVFGLCLALHFGFTEEVKEEENGRDDGEEEGEEEEKEIDEEEEPSRHNSSVATPDGWYYNPDADDDDPPPFDPTDYGGTPDEFFAALEAAEAVADAARSVCRLRFLRLKKG